MADVAVKPKKQIFVKVFHDEYAESPVDRDVFSLVVFDRRSIYYGQLPEDKLKPEDIGRTWWPLSCYEHGAKHYSIRGTESYVDPWDTTLNAGVLFITSGDPTEVGPDPTTAAKGFIAEFNDWANGDCWGYDISYEEYQCQQGTCPCCHTPNVEWGELEVQEWQSCGGFIGRDYFVSAVIEEFHSLLSWYNGRPELAGPLMDASSYKVSLNPSAHSDHSELVEAFEALGFSVTRR